jgi:uncharacterized protein YdhG (YjbR/CyaY superfamily)
MARTKFESITQYIDASPSRVKPILRKIRKEVRNRIPEAKETLSYGMPAFRGNKVFFYFAAFKEHIGIYPPVASASLKRRLAPFMNEKGNLAFPLDEEIPIDLIGLVAEALWRQICQ